MTATSAQLGSSCGCGGLLQNVYSIARQDTGRQQSCRVATLRLCGNQSAEADGPKRDWNFFAGGLASGTHGEQRRSRPAPFGLTRQMKSTRSITNTRSEGQRILKDNAGSVLSCLEGLEACTVDGRNERSRIRRRRILPRIL